MTADIRPLGLVLILASCAAAASDDPVPPGMARVKSPSAWSMKPAPAEIVAVDGKPFDGRVIALAPGHHVFTVKCTMENAVIPLGEFGILAVGSLNQLDFPLDLKDGHEYQFTADLPDHPHEGCTPYVYDSTDGHDADSESLNAIPVIGRYGDWEKFASSDHAGHYIFDWLPKDQYRKQQRHFGRLSPDMAHQRPGWVDMFETESWVSLSYPGSADEFFKQDQAAMQSICPAVQTDIVSESAGDVTYVFRLGPECTGTDVRVELGRYLTGAYDIHHAVIISRAPLADADKAAWIDALKNATVTDDD